MPLLLSDFHRIEKFAASLLAKHHVKEAPVHVTEIAKELSLDVIEYDLGGLTSGVLIVENGKGTIGYNPNDPEVRQRFTVAHELGHFLLHVKRKLDEKVFIDKDYLVKYR